jgi:HD-GYP domain-containing protein (c-di-GMP phosphodiesterase class II)
VYAKIPVAELEVGMFVADIDRPWMDTPFLIQGFLIEDAAQIEQVRKFCQSVTIDRARSSAQHQLPAQKSVPQTRERPDVIVHYRPAPGSTVPAPRTGIAPPPNPAQPTSQASAKSPATGREEGIEDLVITTRDAQFRPTESGRFQLTPMPSAETGNAPPAPAAEPGPGMARSFMEALGRFLRGEAGSPRSAKSPSVPSDTPEDATPHAPARPKFLPPTMHLVIYEDAVAQEVEQEVAKETLHRTEDLLQRLEQDIRNGSTLALAEVDEVISDMVDSMVRNPDALMWVMRLREKDATTYGHGLYASVYLLALGRHLGFPKQQLSHLGTIGLLLDIGKIKLPRELLEKTGSLTTDEYDTIKTHVQLGIDILSESPTLDQDILVGIAQHHERENGTGYPQGLAGPNISLYGRMAAIADCFAALTNQRPYAEAVSAYDALRSLSGWGGDYFHAPIVEQFIQAVGVFPVGSMVELSTGEVAAVISHNKTRRLKPRVLIITGPDKTRSAHPATMDLLYAPTDANGQSIFIRRGLASGAYGLDARDFYLS